MYLASLTFAVPVSKNICWAFSYLGDKYENVPSNNVFRTKADTILSSLFANAYRNDLGPADLVVIDMSILAIISIIHYSNQAEMSLKYLNLFLTSWDNLKQP